jgi:opacity protein-like surface antigen
MTWKDDEETYSDDFEMLIGLNLGVSASFEISRGLMFETGLGLSQKGFKTSYEGSTGTYRVNYLDIPLTIKKSLGDKIFVQAGPYLGFAVSGTSKGKSDGETTDSPIDLGSDKEDDDQKRLDFGLTFGAGAMVTDKIQVGLSYGLGLANVATDTEGGYKETNQVIGITLGYSLAK